jgi:small GTP-binding protein
VIEEKYPKKCLALQISPHCPDLGVLVRFQMWGFRSCFRSSHLRGVAARPLKLVPSFQTRLSPLLSLGSCENLTLRSVRNFLGSNQGFSTQATESDDTSGETPLPFSYGSRSFIPIKELPKDVTFPLDHIRNFSIIAHIDHGKSTLSDKILQMAGNIGRLDKDQMQILDSLEVERQRGITVKAQSASICYIHPGDKQPYLLNLIDTPGHVDFSYEVSRSLAASQGVLLLVDASEGVQAQTLANFYLAFAAELDIVPVITKVDLPHADADAVTQEMIDTFDVDPKHIIRCSAKTGFGVEHLFPALVKRVKPPPAPGAVKNLPITAANNNNNNNNNNNDYKNNNTNPLREQHDASGRLSIDLGDDGPMFQVYASRLEEICKGKRIQRLDVTDTSYWDYDVEGTRIVLHSDELAGISLYVEDGSRDDLLRRVAGQINAPGALPNKGSSSGAVTDKFTENVNGSGPSSDGLLPPSTASLRVTSAPPASSVGGVGQTAFNYVVHSTDTTSISSSNYNSTGLPAQVGVGTSVSGYEGSAGLEKAADEAALLVADERELKLSGKHRAFLFDCWYDRQTRRGVILLVTVMEGELRVSDRLQGFHSGRTHDVQELGLLTPDLVPTERLQAGQVGYVVAGIKSSSDVRLGDTFFKVGVAHRRFNPAVAARIRKDVSPMPGFAPSKPTVHCGLFPAQSSSFEELQAALEKLLLHDASVTVKNDFSLALGQGFRCGFLGVLHMDVFSTRLEQEFDVSVIITAPTVGYAAIVEGQRVSLSSPVDYVSGPKVSAYFQPMVQCSIIAPTEHMLELQNLVRLKKGDFKDISILTTSANKFKERSLLKARMPLAEVMVDFYDRVKSISSGYASVEFEPAGEEEVELVKLDTKINNESVDALSVLCPEDEAQVSTSSTPARTRSTCVHTRMLGHGAPLGRDASEEHRAPKL